MKKEIVYQGTSIKKANVIRDVLEQNKISYKFKVFDTESILNMPFYMFLNFPVFFWHQELLEEEEI
ncbi:MAG: hypothetical protein PHD70_13130 [Anaerostipes sp.]|nr:hypothetical protein [Anaerostipes sp.]MDD3747399.1 hypothetical protein [Anaerostipes sp.]